MIYHDTDARALFARERAQLLANEMRRGRNAKGDHTSGRLERLLAHVSAQRRKRQYEAPAYEG
jgi:hypothetical protein